MLNAAIVYLKPFFHLTLKTELLSDIITIFEELRGKSKLNNKHKQVIL